MALLVINCGSSSVKFAVFDGETALVRGGVEALGTPRAKGRYRDPADIPKPLDVPEHCDHRRALEAAFHAIAADPALGDREIQAIGHRIVHGGAIYAAPTPIDATTLHDIRELAPLAPVHAEANALGIEAAMALFPGLPQVAVFDTAFHQSIPPAVYHYAIPSKYHALYQIRRYGFHGTSHEYVATEAIRRLGLDPGNSRLLIAHLGNGCSATAVRDSRSADTSMGLTPLEGLVMGSRSGNVDPNLHHYLARRSGMSLDQITDILNHRSGLAGLSGSTNDFRMLSDEARAGSAPAKLAIDVFCYRLARELAGLAAALGGPPDALVFTGGIGENSALARAQTLGHLGVFGPDLDPRANDHHGRDTGGLISRRGGSGPSVLVIPTDEELAIARATRRIAGII
jgi:acetate kinase